MLLEEQIDLDKLVNILVLEESAISDMAAFGAQVSAQGTSVQPVQRKTSGKKWQSGGRGAEKGGDRSAGRQYVTCYSRR